jgi:hypothetical protein
MTRQQFQISLPLTIPAGSLVVNWAVRADETAPLTTSTGYSNRRYNALGGGEIATTVLLALQALPVSGTWTLAEQAGIKGRVRFQCTDTQTVTSLTLPTGLGAILGFASDVLTPAITGSTGAWVSTFDAPYRQRGLYIPEPEVEVYFDADDWRDVGTVIAAQAQTGAGTLDIYPTVRRRTLAVQYIGGYSGRASYVDAGYGAGVGIDASDPNVSWEEFVALWREQASPVASSQQGAARLALSTAAPATFVVVYLDALAPWVADPARALVQASPAPLLYELAFDLLEAP